MPFIASTLHRRAAVGLLLALLAATALPGPASAAPEPALAPAPRRVVILMATDPAQPAARQIDDAFRKALEARNPGNVSFFGDTMDTMRFRYDSFAPEFLAVQRKKYADQRVDLVVGIGDGAIDFIRDHAREVWPGAPVVLTGLDAALVDRTKLPAGAASFVWRLDIDGMLGTAATLQPTAQRLIIVGGNTEFDLGLTQRVAAQAANQARWQVERWNTLSVEQLKLRLAVLDGNSAVVYTSMHRDTDGRAVFPADALARIAATSGAPIYGLYGTYIGRGAAAGSVVDFADSGRRAAELAHALLRGQPAAAPDALQFAATHCVADYVQLQAHHLRVEDLPAGCEVRNAPRNLWTEYRAYVLVAAAVLLLQALTIGTLLVQRRRRQTAEVEALQRRTELSRAMRFAAIGELTASIAHEINQPLGAILSNADAAELLLKAGKASTDDLREILADIRRDDLRAHEVIRRLRALLEKHEVEHRDLHLHPVLGDVLALLAPEARRRGVSIEHAFEAANDRLHGDPVQLQQVLLNLALNALDAMEQTDPSRRRLRITTADHGDRLELMVADRGPGIEPARRQAVFESFYTTKPRGLGLGLPIVRAIVEAHQGSITVTPNEGGGTVFTVTLPRRLTAHTAAELSPAAGATPGLLEATP